MNQQEANDLYALALDVQLRNVEVGRALAEVIRHLTATQGLTPEQIQEPEPQEAATSVESTEPPAGESHSQPATEAVPHPSRQAPRDITTGEPITTEADEQEAATNEDEPHGPFSPIRRAELSQDEEASKEGEQ